MNATLHGISLATFHQWLWRHVQQGLARTCRRALPVWLPSASRIPWLCLGKELIDRLVVPIKFMIPLVADAPWQGARWLQICLGKELIDRLVRPIKCMKVCKPIKNSVNFLSCGRSVQE